MTFISEIGNIDTEFTGKSECNLSALLKVKAFTREKEIDRMTDNQDFWQSNSYPSESDFTGESTGKNESDFTGDFTSEPQDTVKHPTEAEDFTTTTERQPMYRREYANQFGISPSLVTKILKILREYHDERDLFDSKKRLTVFCQEEIEYYREVGVNEYKRQNAALKNDTDYEQSVGQLATYKPAMPSSFRDKIAAQDFSQKQPITPEVVVDCFDRQDSFLAKAQQNRTEGDQISQLLAQNQQSLSQAELENAMAEGYNEEAAKYRARQMGKLYFWQEINGDNSGGDSQENGNGNGRK